MHKNMLDATMELVKHRVEPQRYQIFDFYVNKDWPAKKVAERFGVPIDRVYQIKHRLTASIREEASRLEKEMA